MIKLIDKDIGRLDVSVDNLSSISFLLAIMAIVKSEK